MDCTRSVTPADAARLQDILGELPAGAVLCLGEGRYDVQLRIERSLTLRGRGAVILDGHYRGPVLWVPKKDVELVVEKLTLKHGSGGGNGEGGNLSVNKQSKISLFDVTLLEGEADHNGGGALQARAGEILLERCRLIGNRGKKSQAVQAEGQAVITLRDSVVSGGQGPGPALLVDGGARVIVEHSLIGGNGSPAAEVAGKATDGRLALDVQSSIVGDPIHVVSGGVRVNGSALTQPFSGDGNLVQAFKVDENGVVTPAMMMTGRGPRR